jgi:hypothetical protein
MLVVVAGAGCVGFGAWSRGLLLLTRFSKEARKSGLADPAFCSFGLGGAMLLVSTLPPSLLLLLGVAVVLGTSTVTTVLDAELVDGLTGGLLS